jgi:N-acetylglucosamine malate deacetylase 1
MATAPDIPKLMVVGAHAGDGEVMAGPVVSQHAADGGTATLLHLTLGERGHPSLPGPQYGLQKCDEAQAAAAALGAKVRFLGYRDGELAATEEAKRAVAQIIVDQQPDVVITHGEGSFHRDHAACHEIVSEAVFYAGLADLWPSRSRHIVKAVYFAENWEDKRVFAPDLYIDTSRGHATWLQALQCYELFRGGLSSFPYLRYYEALAVVRGAESGTHYAKAFSVPPHSRRTVVPGLLGEIPLPVITGSSIITPAPGTQGGQRDR